MPTEFKHDGPTRTLGDTERLSDVVKVSIALLQKDGNEPCSSEGRPFRGLVHGLR